MRKLFLVLMAVMLSFWGFSYAVEAEGGRGKKLNIYYANWSIYGKVHQGQQVRDLPWDRISTINHSFWKIQPNDTHTEFSIVSIDEEADFGDGNCFDQYAEMVVLYPDVDVVLAIGGWSDTRWFAEMAATKGGRESFIQSCIETLRAYPFLGGIDIDWEYPGTSRNHEGAGFVGSSEDKGNFTALMREMRESFDKVGLEDKIITYCAPAGIGRLKSGEVCIDFAAMDPYVDRVNIMTYDMAGSWSKKALHHAPLFPGKGAEYGASVAEVVDYLLGLGVSPGKMNIGSPLYSQGWVVAAENGEEALGKEVSEKKAQGTLASGQFQWFELVKMETRSGWEAIFDEESAAAFLYNSDPESLHYQYFLSYESHRSLKAKLDYINEMGLGGMIVWASGGDSIEMGYPMLTQMAAGLGLYDGDILTEFAVVLTDEIDAETIANEGETNAMEVASDENGKKSLNKIGTIGLLALIIIAALIAWGVLAAYRR